MLKQALLLLLRRIFKKTPEAETAEQARDAERLAAMTPEQRAWAAMDDHVRQ